MSGSDKVGLMAMGFLAIVAILILFVMWSDRKDDE